MVYTRKEKRTPVTLKIKFKSATLGQFIERYAVDVSHGGIFIRTKDPLQVGTPMRFEFQLQDSSPLISGEGIVVWTREHDPKRSGVSPGMGVRFDKLTGASKGVLQQILSQKAKSAGGPRFDQDNTPVRPKAVPPRAPGVRKPRSATNLPLTPGGSGLGLAPRTGGFESDTGSKDGTPLPKPMPFHSTVDDDFSNEVFDQPTRVAAIDEIMREGNADADDDDENATVEYLVAEPQSSSSAVPPAATKPEASGSTIEIDPGTDPGTDLGMSESGAPLTRPGAAAVSQSEISPRKSSSTINIVLMVAILVVVAGGVFVVMKDRLLGLSSGQATATEDPKDDGMPVDDIVVPPAIDAMVETGIVVPIGSDPEGATVMVDGEERGTTPFRLSGLEDGNKHKIEIVKACYQPDETNLVVAEGATIDATLKPYIRLLRVISEPANATLYIDGQRKGHTPRDVRLVSSLKPNEPHVVRVTKANHEAAETKVLPDAPCKTERRVGVIEVSLRLIRKTVDDEPTPERDKRREPRVKPAKSESPDPPKDDPPKDDPPKGDPPKINPPKVNPPKTDPPKVDPPKDDPPEDDFKDFSRFED